MRVSQGEGGAEGAEDGEDREERASEMGAWRGQRERERTLIEGERICEGEAEHGEDREEGERGAKLGVGGVCSRRAAAGR